MFVIPFAESDKEQAVERVKHLINTQVDEKKVTTVKVAVMYFCELITIFFFSPIALSVPLCIDN